MKHLRLVISLCALSVCAVRAQDEKQGPPPVEIPDFSNLDEYIYVPKSTLHFGTRFISGPKSSFSGKGRISTNEDSGAPTGTATSRAYHDGNVLIDTRTTAVDNGDGTTSSIPLPADGKTNTWNYTDSRQLTSDGLITFHTYTAEVLDAPARNKDVAGTIGTEVYVDYSMGKLGKYLEWSIIAGFSMNDIGAKVHDNVKANLTSINDTYNLFGEIPPVAPYTAGNGGGTTTVTNSDGTSGTITSTDTTLLGSTPLQRTSTTTTDSTSVSNLWKMKGAYYTFRAGPSISLPIGSRFHASISAGPSMVYSGTTYTVTQTYQPELGSEVTAILSDGTSRLLAGYYADATLQFDLTERTGFYFGAVYQANGSYDQTVSNGDAKYTTKIDLNRLNGLRGGLTFRF